MQVILKKIGKIAVWLAVVMAVACGLTGCNNLSVEGARLQKMLSERMRYADAVTEEVCGQIQSSSFDSVWSLTQIDDNVFFYVFDRGRMVFWSDNNLTASDMYVREPDKWFYQRMNHVHCVVRWTQADRLSVLTVVPVKYEYAVSGSLLKNHFIPPFRGRDSHRLVYMPEHGHTQRDIFSNDGRYLFSLDEDEPDSAAANESVGLDRSFSYRRLSNMDNETGTGEGTVSVQIYYLLTLVLFVVALAFGISGLVRNHGFKEMRLRTRFLYLIVALVLTSFMCIFWVSVAYLRRNFEERQRATMVEKCRYIQSALQNQYFLNLNLSERNTSGLNIDLRDLAYTFGTDIHVYDLNGHLVGSSIPQLFTLGMLSGYIAPAVYFSHESTLTRYERLGDLRYLTGYTDFINGANIRLGYISVPSFISGMEVRKEVDNYLRNLLPIYLLVLVVALLLSFYAAHIIQSPLTALTDKMRNYRLGKREHLNYDRNDELGELVKQYNDLVDELERSSRRLAQSEREGAWRTMARQIAHEINNPLTPMKLTIQQLQRVKDTERFDEMFGRATNMLIEQIDNLSRIATSFSTFAKMPQVSVSEVDVAEKLTSAIALFANNPWSIPIRYVGPDSGVMVYADREQIQQVFSNIIKNALQAIASNTAEDGTAVETGDIIVMLKDLGQKVEISFSDNGPGIPQEVGSKIFMPNFTTKSNGAGLGLAISRNIVEGSDGQITFDTSDKGTTFYVYLQKT